MSGDTTRPTVSSVSPTDNSTDVSVSTAVAVTFSETMSTSTITTNTDNTTCSGSFKLSSDNFTTCIKMSAVPSASNSDKTFSVTPDDNLSRGTTYKLQITTSVTDTSSNSLASAYTTTNGFTTYGTGTIKGTVRYDNNTAADNVSVVFSKSGTYVDNTTTNTSGDYSQDNLSLGTYTLTYSKSDFNDANQTVTLTTDGETLVASNLILLASGCDNGTIRGTIKNAVNGSAVDNVSLSVLIGVNASSGTIVTTATTDNSGDYSLPGDGYDMSKMRASWYTVQTSKTGYISSTFNVFACGNKTGQDASISPTMSSGTMRIVLSWPTGSTAGDLDSHLTGPDNGSGRFHITYPGSGTTNYYYFTNGYDGTCSSCSESQMSDNVTIDLDDRNAPGTETTTITKVRDGIYRFYVHEYGASSSSTNISTSGASVKVYYNNTVKSYSPPNSAGNLWGVFTFTLENNVGLTGADNMTAYINFNAIE